MDKELYNFLMKWLALHQEWKSMLIGGTGPSRWSDGYHLNGIRNRMLWVIKDLNEAGYTLEQLTLEAKANGFEIDETMKELPPEMSPFYMKDTDIKQKAEAALNIYVNSPDYQYVQENLCGLNEIEDAHIIKYVKDDVDFVRILTWLIQMDRLPDMRKYLDVPRYLEKLAHAKDLLMMRINYLQPFS